MKKYINEVEDLRAWVRGRGKYREIANATGYPYDSLCKFADGRVAEPRLSHIRTLQEFRDNNDRRKNRQDNRKKVV